MRELARGQRLKLVDLVDPAAPFTVSLRAEAPFTIDWASRVRWTACWQFVGVGGSRFDFLEKLDDLKDRFIDNADFFAVPDPSRLGDPEMYQLLLQEYPGWVRLARQRGLLT